MPSGTKKRKVSKEAKRHNLAVWGKSPQLNHFIFQQYFQAATFKQWCKPGLRSRSRKESEVLGGVGVEFLSTLGVWVGYFVRLDSGSPIESFFTSHSQICNSCWNGAICFETFVETNFLLCTTISIDFNSQISFPLSWGVGVGSRKFCKGRSWSRIVCLRLRNPGVNQNTWKYGSKSRQLWSTFHTQRDWPYWHVIFPVLWFAISGFWLLFGWILFLAESLSGPVVLNFFRRGLTQVIVLCFKPP